MRRVVLKVVAGLLYSLGILRLVLLMEQLVGRRRHVVALVYHHLRAEDDSRQGLSPLARGLPIKDFERHIEMLRSWYRPITAAELESILEGKTRLACDALLVTFDDGYRDQRTLAEPCLRRHGLSAAVFISTGMIDTGRRFWWVRLDDLLSRASSAAWKIAASTLACNEEAYRVMNSVQLGNWQDRENARRKIVSVLRGAPPGDREAILNHFDSNIPAGEATCLPTLSWSEIREMARDGFTLGAHTHTHPRLTRLTHAEISKEIAGSVEVLHRELGIRPTAFAYPAGDYDQAVAREVAKAELRMAFTTRPGTITPGVTPPYELPRISLWRSSRGELALTVVAIKLAKYFPSLVLPLLSHLVGAPGAEASPVPARR